MKPILWTLALLAVATVNGTTYADHDYGTPYSGGSNFRGTQNYHDGLQHRNFHRQQSHDRFHDSLNHSNYDRQYNSFGGGYGWSQPYSGSFNAGNGYGNFGYGSPSYDGYGPTRQHGGYGSSWSPRW